MSFHNERFFCLFFVFLLCVFEMCCCERGYLFKYTRFMFGRPGGMQVHMLRIDWATPSPRFEFFQSGMRSTSHPSGVPVSNFDWIEVNVPPQPLSRRNGSCIWLQAASPPLAVIIASSLS